MALVKQHFWDYDWHQSLSLLAGLLDNPIPLLETITREKDDIFSTLLLLAGRCVAECEEMAHPLITEIIDKIYQLWQSYPFAGFIESTVVALGQANSQMLYKLQQALEEKYYYQRKEFFAALVTALGQIGSPQAVETLIQILNQSPWYMRGEAAEALIPLLRQEDSTIRKHAVEALGQIGGASVVEALIPVLHDRDGAVRESAAVALSRIGSCETLETLLQRPKTDIYRPEIFPLIRMLAVRCSKENMPLIPVYPELIGPFGLIHRLWRRLVAHQPSTATRKSKVKSQKFFEHKVSTRF